MKRSRTAMSVIVYRTDPASWDNLRTHLYGSVLIQEQMMAERAPSGELAEDIV